MEDCQTALKSKMSLKGVAISRKTAWMGKVGERKRWAVHLSNLQ